MNRATAPTGWVRNPVMISPGLDPVSASSYEFGWTWNPCSGCLNHTPEGLCLGGLFPCYAWKLANGRLKNLYLSNPAHIAHLTVTDHPDPFAPRIWPEKLLELRTRKPRYQTLTKAKGIFVCDMSDLFGIGIPEEWTQQVMETIKNCPQHRFYLLTKQAQNLLLFSPFPDHCYVGVTATNMWRLADACYILKRVEAKVKYISLEPLLDFTPTEDLLAWNMATAFIEAGINQVIIGACTGTKKDLIELNKRYPGLTLMPYGRQWTAQPQIEAIEMIVREADQAGAKVFLKGNLWPLFDGSHYAVPMWAFDKESHLRQEIPVIH